MLCTRKYEHCSKRHPCGSCETAKPAIPYTRVEREMKRKLQFCGAFNGTVAMRPGESEDEAIDRVTDTMNRILERHARRLDINVQAEKYEGDVLIEYREVAP